MSSYNNNKAFRETFRRLQEADWEQNRKGFGINVAIVDDMAEIYADTINDLIYPCQVDPYTIERFNKRFAKDFQLDSAPDIHNAWIFDGSYREGGKSAIDMRAKILTAHPSLSKNMMVMVGTDAKEHIKRYDDNSDRLNPAFKEMMNTPHTEYTNKVETIVEFLLEKSKELGYPTQRITLPKGEIRDEIMPKLEKLLFKSSKAARLLREVSDLTFEINKLEPQNEDERRLLDMTGREEAESLFNSHSIGQYVPALGAYTYDYRNKNKVKKTLRQLSPRMLRRTVKPMLRKFNASIKSLKTITPAKEKSYKSRD